MKKTTKNKIVVVLVFLLAHLSTYAQYSGGIADGSSSEQLSLTSCPLPLHFYAYMGGTGDGSGTDILATTTCGIPSQFYAYLGGIGDGFGSEQMNQVSCGFPSQFYAYLGGISDGAASETITANVCGFPPHFYAYLGGSGNGYHMEMTAPVCPTQPPVASFTASATTICVGQSVTFTDTSTNIPGAWIWTLPGGTPNTSTTQNPVVTYSTPGTYNVTLQAFNFNGNNTVVMTNHINVIAVPTVTSTTPGSRCDAGTVTLQATASAGTLNWYDAPTGGNLVGTGTSFTTPSISATTTYYVQTSVGSCMSGRTAVIATVNTTPLLASTTPASRCGTGNITLSATAATGTIRWYDAPTAGTLLTNGGTLTLTNLAVTTTYYVEVTNGFCTSPRTAVIATILPTPSITSTTPATRCDVGTLTLLAVASSGTINWYDAPTGGNLVATGGSFTTPSLAATTTYYVESTNGTCASSRTAVTATVNLTPLVTATTPGNRCDLGPVTLQATASSGTLSWYDAPTGGLLLGTGTTFTTPTIAVTTTYYVSAANGTCASPRSAVIATVNASPTVTTTTPASICSGDSFTISATASAGTLSWYNLPTGGTLLGTGSNYSQGSLSATTTYYVQATNGSCSSARTPVEVTVTNRPTLTSSTPGSRCGTGTVILAATFSSGTVNWYDAPLLGNLVGTGSTLVTPSLSATTTYYAEATNGSCTSLVRTAVTATVNVTPTITSTTPGSRCGTGTVTLQAVASSGTLSWFDAPTGGNLVGTGATLVTPTIAVSTTFYVSAANGTCTSSRTAVLATVNTTPTITSTTGASRCDTGTLVLQAVAPTGTINWYDAPTAGNLVGTGASFTTPSISITTTYYVEVENGTCTSARTPVLATVNATPSITSTTPGSRCDAGSVTLQATASSGILSWYDAPTAGNLVGTGGTFVTPSIAATTTYYVSAANGSCTSIRTAVIATVNSSPTITATTPASICSGDSFTISATASAGTLSWYNLPTGGTLLGTGSSYSLGSLGTTTIYYVQATNGSCASARTAVQVTVTNRPTNTSTTPGSRCGNGTVVLAATFSSGTVNWYDAPLLGNLVGTGSTFVTPVLSATTTYYAEATNGSCTSSVRTAVTATVNSQPIILSTTPASRCGAGDITLQASSASGTIRWYDAATGGNLVATGPNLTLIGLGATTTFYVEVTDGSCTSGRTAVVATINPLPLITSTTPASRCDVGTVMLQAVAATGTINWYDAPTAGNLVGTGASFTTPVIAASTTYYVEVTNGTCTSARTAVTATVNATPGITATTPGSRCDAGIVTLQATATSGTINWYDAPTGGNLVGSGATFTTPTIAVTTTYYVSATNGSCTSVRTAVIATVNAAPTITSTTPATICSGDTFVISATASAGTLSWYNVPTGGTVQGTGSTFSTSLGATATFYVQATDGSCQSVRTPVVVTVTQRPTNVTAVGASRCGTGSVTLNATFTNGVVNWYDAPTAGNLVFTGSSFVTPSLAVSTTYYVEGANGTCLSTVRTPVTATINASPTITSTTPASRCGTGTVTLTASSSAGTLSWYNLPTGGAVLGTGTSFTTPTIAATTIYYVEVTNGTCTSTRTAVTATVDIMQTITSTTPATRCDAGTLTLTAVATGGTLNWYDAPTAGNLVGTGSAFTTPNISATTTYYVEVTNGTCTSVRTAVTASIAPTAAPTANAAQTFCAGETVGLIAVVGTNIIWYDAPTNGNVVPPGTALVSGTTYYASQTVGGCESATRVAVTMTLGNCLGNEEFVANVIKVYPNPVIDILNISSSNDAMTKIEVVNMLGQIVFSNKLNEMETTVDMARYAAGTYIVLVSVDDAFQTFKVIKR